MSGNTASDFSFLCGKILSGGVYRELFSLEPTEWVVNLGCGEGPQAVVYSGCYRTMIGIDINPDRLHKSLSAAERFRVSNYSVVCGNVEALPLARASFDKALAVDIIEHVQDPKAFCSETYRSLKQNGELLITFPAMHDTYTAIGSKIVRVLRRRERRRSATAWDPDVHNQEYPLNEWVALVEGCGFSLVRSRASTLFPPLHLCGIPRFWFSCNTIHRIDRFFCSLPAFKNFGQALVCVFRKI